MYGHTYCGFSRGTDIMYRLFAQFFYKREPERGGAELFLETQVCHCAGTETEMSVTFGVPVND